MVCCSCVQKLAFRLMRNHKIDMITAMMRADQGMQRFEERKRSEKPKIFPGKGNPSDYSQSCVETGYCDCNVGGGCLSASDCRDDYACCTCPAPLANSHQVADNCINYMTGCLCIRYRCSGTCACNCVGTCEYDCDEDFEWDGEACVPVGVVVVLRRLKRGVGL